MTSVSCLSPQSCAWEPVHAETLQAQCMPPDRPQQQLTLAVLSWEPVHSRASFGEKATLLMSLSWAAVAAMAGSLSAPPPRLWAVGTVLPPFLWGLPCWGPSRTAAKSQTFRILSTPPEARYLADLHGSDQARVGHPFETVRHCTLWVGSTSLDLTCGHGVQG